MKRRNFLLLSFLGSFGLTTCTKLLPHDSKKAAVRANSSPSPASTSEGKPLLRFVSVGDTGTGAKGQYAVATAMANYHQQNPYPLVLLAGDNIYNNGEIEKVEAVFEQPYKPLLQKGVQFRASLGNHDIRTDNGDPQVAYPGFNMEGRYYTFRQENVQFFALDTNLYYTRNPQNNPAGDAQLAWLERELSRSDAPWKVVFGHHQIYSSGHYGVNQAFIQKFTPLFEKYNVQLYINGHDHHYERSRDINGTTYLICGGGAGTRSVEQSDFTAHAASRLSFATYDVYEDRIEIKGIGTDGVVFDEGEILS
ncbi:metallophosphoesterase family protein [Lusitaniella coriacea]|uniref:metallophosphoesterase family protein n=1 Tax=Lusitaniella coriacea TaxID=1983105 RepID=UPI003CF282A0